MSEQLVEIAMAGYDQGVKDGLRLAIDVIVDMTDVEATTVTDVVALLTERLEQ